jgi:hypothetical protein
MFCGSLWWVKVRKNLNDGFAMRAKRGQISATKLRAKNSQAVLWCCVESIHVK